MGVAFNRLLKSRYLCSFDDVFLRFAENRIF